MTTETKRTSPFAITVLAGLTGAAFGFTSFASALWANIYKDGHPGAGTVEIAAGLFPLYALVLPGLLVAWVAMSRGYDTARTVFGAAAATLQFAIFYPLLAWFVVLTAAKSVKRRRFSGARMDVVAILSGLSITAIAVVAEAARG